jgi:hypothetical protein
VAASLQRVGHPEDLLASTSTALVRRRGGVVVCYDVKGYYAALGVPATATRQELGRAYLAAGGPQDHRLTYIFHKLLDRSFRARYDALKPGQTTLDRYDKDELLRRASLRAAQLNSERDFYISAIDILKSIGVEFADVQRDSLDSAEGDGFHGSRSTFRQEDLSNPVSTWSYAYLLLASTCDDVPGWPSGRKELDGRPGGPWNSPIRRRIPRDVRSSRSSWLKPGFPVFFLHEEADVTGELPRQPPLPPSG